MNYLILVRHGQSEWNLENRFTGWVDVDLAAKGKLEACKAGELIKKLGIELSYFYTSLQSRSIETLNLILNTMRIKNQEIVNAWELNERHYGSLTGLNKEDTKKKIGDEQFKKYRRSWDTQPPPIAENDKNHSLFSPLNASIPLGMIPFTESLKDTYKRVIPYYENEIQKHIKENKNVLISAHGNSLRALCKYLFKISDQKINELEIPTGNPLIIEFDNSLKIQKYYYLDEKRAKTIIINQ